MTASPQAPSRKNSAMAARVRLAFRPTTRLKIYLYGLHHPDPVEPTFGAAKRQAGCLTGRLTPELKTIGGDFVRPCQKTLRGNPYDGQTLKAVITEIETQIGAPFPHRGRPRFDTAPTTKWRSPSLARSAASSKPSNATCAGARRSSRHRPGKGRTPNWPKLP